MYHVNIKFPVVYLGLTIFFKIWDEILLIESKGAWREGPIPDGGW